MMACVACCGVRTVKLTVFDMPPPGLVTVTLKLPAVAISEAKMAAASCVVSTKVVIRAFPLKLTVEPLTKFVPFTIKVKPAPPAMALVGKMLVIGGLNGRRQLHGADEGGRAGVPVGESKLIHEIRLVTQCNMVSADDVRPGGQFAR
jgi:hypothetical protein